MAIGCGPDVTGNLGAGAVCVDCSGQAAGCRGQSDQEYGRGTTVTQALPASQSSGPTERNMNLEGQGSGD
jgi:hypothetical protein